MMCQRSMVCGWAQGFGAYENQTKNQTNKQTVLSSYCEQIGPCGPRILMCCCYRDVSRSQEQRHGFRREALRRGPPARGCRDATVQRG